MRSWRKECENRGQDFLIPQEKYGVLDIEDNHRLFFRFLFLIYFYLFISIFWIFGLFVTLQCAYFTSKRGI